VLVVLVSSSRNLPAVAIIPLPNVAVAMIPGTVTIKSSEGGEETVSRRQQQLLELRKR
jgi:hypothetical protein